MDQGTAARLADEAIGRMSAAELRACIASAGLAHADCTGTEALRARAREARDLAREIASPARGSSTQGGAAAGGSAAGGRSVAAAAPMMPPVTKGRQLQIMLPGSAWSEPVLVEAVGTHGLLEIEQYAPRRSARGWVGALYSGWRAPLVGTVSAGPRRRAPTRRTPTSSACPSPRAPPSLVARRC